MEVNGITEEDRRLAEEAKDEGNKHYKSKDYSNAISLYSKAIKLCPDNASYYSNRSAAQMMINKHRSALEDAMQATKVDQHFAKGYLRVAKCYIALGNPTAALLSLQKAKELDTNLDKTVMHEVQLANRLTNFESESNQGFESKDYRKVEYCMRRALEISPSCVAYKLKRAESLALLGKYSDASDITCDVLRSDKMNADAVYVRALCLYYDDDIDKAVNFLTHCLKLSPDHKNAKTTLRKAKQLAAKKAEGNSAFKSANHQKAYDLYTEALQIDDKNRRTNAKLFCNRALVGFKLGKVEEAAEDCTRAIDLDEKYLRAYQRRAQYYMKLEKYDEAVYDYKKIMNMEPTRENKENLADAERTLKRSQRKDYYKILGVSQSAGDDEIKKAYKKKALRFHPDRHANATDEEKKEAEKQFKEIGEAYAILSDPKKRGRFDRGEDLNEGPSGAHGFDANNIFQMFFNQGGGPFGGGGMPGGMGGDFGGGNSGFTFHFG